MASNYGYNFGFRRSDESMRSGTEGRQRVPAAGSFRIGDLVELDAAAPGFIKKSAAGAPLIPGFRGLLIQEDAWDVGVHDNQVLLTQDLDVVRNGALCAIWTGAGIKVWLRNTDAVANPGQRARAAREIVAGAADIAVGDYLGWDGDNFVETAVAAERIAIVTLSNASDYVEATLLA